MYCFFPVFEYFQNFQHVTNLSPKTKFPTFVPPCVQDALIAADSNFVIGASIGKRVILPATYTGSPRAMTQLFHDAMSMVANKGKPELFITITCNPKWREIVSQLLPGQDATDRPDITDRVFLQKVLLESLILCSTLRPILPASSSCTVANITCNLILPIYFVIWLNSNEAGVVPVHPTVTKNQNMNEFLCMQLKYMKMLLLEKHVLGKVIAHVDVIEFQKRGLPHCHILLIFDKDSRLRTPEDVDSIVSAAIPGQSMVCLHNASVVHVSLLQFLIKFHVLYVHARTSIDAVIVLQYFIVICPSMLQCFVHICHFRMSGVPFL